VALLVVDDSLFGSGRNSKKLVDLIAKHRLPAMYHSSTFIDLGGLMSYSVDRPDMMRRLAGHVDKILRGAKPADLPVEQPTKFELVLNVKTAKALAEASCAWSSRSAQTIVATSESLPFKPDVCKFQESRIPTDRVAAALLVKIPLIWTLATELAVDPFGGAAAVPSALADTEPVSGSDLQTEQRWHSRTS
jgi:hypothetical protein